MSLRRQATRRARTCAVAAVCLLAGSPARADTTCAPVESAIVTRALTSGCTSPVGFCTIGTIASGPLAGTTRFTATSLEQHGVVTLFTGTFVVTTETGSVSFESTGVLNGITGGFTERFTVVDASGSLAGARAVLVSHGTTAGTGFSGVLRGAMCLPE